MDARRQLESTTHAVATTRARPSPRPRPVREITGGALLRRARRARGLELADVEHALRIRVRHLRALETERFDELPGDVYGRMFLRTYAEYLGLDGDRVVALAALRLVEADEAPPDAAPAEVAVPAVPAEPSRLLVWLDRVVGGVPAGVRRRAWLVVAIAMLLVLALRAGGSPTVGVAPQARTRPQTATLPPADSRLSLPSTPATRPRAAAARIARVELSATSGDCWLLVRTGGSTGPVVFEGMLHQGGAVMFRGKVLWLRVGAPWHLAVRVDGRVAGNLPTRPGDIVVTPRGVATAA